MPVGTYIVGTAPLDPALCERLIPGQRGGVRQQLRARLLPLQRRPPLLFGGRVSYTTMTPPDLKGVMAQRMAQVFPELKDVPVEFVWGGFVDISMNRAPDFGRLGDNLYYLQGFSGHGVALTGLAGQLVAEAVAGQAGRFDLFARLKHHAFPGRPAAAHAHAGAGHAVAPDEGRAVARAHSRGSPRSFTVMRCPEGGPSGPGAPGRESCRTRPRTPAARHPARRGSVPHPA
jgi:glycine/D-amino acid oxidase-like deaminating enzyme